MAADVSSLLSVMNGYKDDGTVGDEPRGGKSAALLTMDLLGAGDFSTKNETQELDLDMEVPSGWEKRLDLKSGKVHLHRCNSSNSTSSSSSSPDYKHQTNQTVSKRQDLNIPTTKTTLSLFDESNLELKLVSSPLPNNYLSVCTLDRVKSALERAEKEPAKKRSPPFWKSSFSPSYSYSSSSSSMREVQEEEENEEKFVSSPIAAGCPGCLSYVMIMKNNPKCPRCNAVVQLPMLKKPRIDLNITI